MLKADGPPGATSNGFNENLALFDDGRCAMWIDATVAAGLLVRPEAVQGRRQGRLRADADGGTYKGGPTWLWSWNLAVPADSKQKDAARAFVTWATCKEYIQLVAKENGWVAVPPGTRRSTYENPEYQKAAPFASFVLKAIESANPNGRPRSPGPTRGRSSSPSPSTRASAPRSARRSRRR